MKIRTAVKWTVRGVGLAAAGYGAYAARAWARYGRVPSATEDEADPLLDHFMPVYEIVERHHVRVEAPADITFAAACEADLMQSPIVRAIFKTRELVLGSEPDTMERPRGLLALTTSIGWGRLAEVPGREILMGAVTQPWEANVEFRSLPPDEFAAFDKPGYVKIAWTLRADPVGETESVFRTETRAVATDPVARSNFRRYWALLSPGIIIIRWLTLGPLKADAERRARAAPSA